ncbi:MAG: CAP domain-containing protein [Saccharofermentanales bacterium]
MARSKGELLLHQKSIGEASVSPTDSAVSSEGVTGMPSSQLTDVPTIKPTKFPTIIPTTIPTIKPTIKPTIRPTAIPTVKPTARPTARPTSKPKPTLTVTPSSGNVFADFQAQVVSLVNKERTSRGLTQLSVSNKLNSIATIKSNEMVDLKYFDHTSPTYGSPFDMLKQFGISYRTAGENIACGQTTPKQVMDCWMDSEGHRANILNPDFKQLGVGIAKNTTGIYYWVEMFIG